MLLGSNSLASAPLMADAVRTFTGTLAGSGLSLSGAALIVAAALKTGAARARQQKVLGQAPLSIFQNQIVHFSDNRTIKL